MAPPLPEPPCQATKLRGTAPAKFWTQEHSVYMLCLLCVLFLLASCSSEAQLRGRLVNLCPVLVADNGVKVNICGLIVAFDTALPGRLGLQARNLDGMMLVWGAFLLQLHPTLLTQAWPSRLCNSCLACKPLRLHSSSGWCFLKRPVCQHKAAWRGLRHTVGFRYPSCADMDLGLSQRTWTGKGTTGHRQLQESQPSARPGWQEDSQLGEATGSGFTGMSSTVWIREPRWRPHSQREPAQSEASGRIAQSLFTHRTLLSWSLNINLSTPDSLSGFCFF